MQCNGMVHAWVTEDGLKYDFAHMRARTARNTVNFSNMFYMLAGFAENIYRNGDHAILVYVPEYSKLIHTCKYFITEHDKTTKMAHAPSEDSIWPIGHSNKNVKNHPTTSPHEH